MTAGSDIWATVASFAAAIVALGISTASYLARRHDLRAAQWADARRVVVLTHDVAGRPGLSVRNASREPILDVELLAAYSTDRGEDGAAVWQWVSMVGGATKVSAEVLLPGDLYVFPGEWRLGGRAQVDHRSQALVPEGTQFSALRGRVAWTDWKDFRWTRDGRDKPSRVRRTQSPRP